MKKKDIIEQLPLMIIVALAGFSVVAICLVLVGQFHTGLVWSLGVLAAITCGWLVARSGGGLAKKRLGTPKEQLFCDVLVLAGVLMWGAWNMPLSSQHIVTDRDPATYAVTSGWLAEYTSFTMDAHDTLEDVPGVDVKSAGFTVVGEGDQTTLHAQGQHVLPALLGAVGKFIGPVKILHFNVLFGMTALLAVYCFGRLFLRSPWALLATAIVAFSLPLLYFSRDTYTEPLALTFSIGGLAFIWLAQQSKRMSVWALAGLVSGASVLTRIDGYLGLIGIAVFFVAYVLFGRKQETNERIKHAAAFWVPAGIVGLLAWIDLKQLSLAYYVHSRSLIKYELFALAAVAVVGVGLYLAVKRYPRLVATINKRTVAWRAMAAFIAVIGAGLLLVSRPIWHEPMTLEQNEVISEIQQAQGGEIEPRTYAELSTYWVSWYVGPVIASLGLVGLAIVAYKSMRDKEMLFLCGLIVIVGTSLVYFVMPSITPDQIWASRRMVPVIIPGIVLFGVYALSLGMDRFTFPSQTIRRFSLAAVGVGLVIAPLVTSAPFLQTPLKKQYQIIGDTCGALPKESAVVLVGMARLTMVQPVRTYCGAEAYNYSDNGTDKPSKERLAEIAGAARKAGKVPILGIYRDQYPDLISKKDQKRMSELRETKFQDMVSTLETAPVYVKDVERHMSLAVINTDGSLKALDL